MRKIIVKDKSINIQSIKDASGNAITYVLNGTTATVSGDDVLNNATPTSATGAIETVMVYTTAATYKLPLKVCTDVINSATEFDEMKKFLVDTTVAAGKQSGLTYCKKIEGYYALGNDIDFADGFANGRIVRESGDFEDNYETEVLDSYETEDLGLFEIENFDE